MSEELHVELQGSRLPMLAILGGFGTVLAAIVFATIWLTKLDDRVLTNAKHIAKTEQILVQQGKVIQQVERNLNKQTYILDHIVKELEKTDK